MHYLHFFSDDGAGEGIFDISDLADDGGTDGRILKRQVGIGCERAVLQHQILAVAEGLRAGYTTTHEPEVLGVPTEVFGMDFGVIDSAVAALPESILGVQHGMVNLDIAGVLEGILARQLQMADTQALGLEERVVGVVDVEVGQLSVTATPESFRAIGHAQAFDGQTVYLAEGFGCIERAVRHAQTAHIPERSPVRGGEMAAGAAHILALPERVHAFEAAVVGLNAAALLESRFALADGDVAELDVPAGV